MPGPPPAPGFEDHPRLLPMPDSSAASSVHGLLPATRRQLAWLFRQDLSGLLQTAESTSDPP